MPKIVWLPSALSDIERIYEYISEKSQEAAQKIALHIKSSALQLSQFPDLGKPLQEEPGMRDYFTLWGNNSYVLRYRIFQERIVIIRVWNTRENWK
jgi:plasmid stabilization system protein ParE